MSLLLAICTAVLFSFGTYLVLQRRLSRIVIGIGMLGHGANLMLMLSAGDRGRPAFIGSTDSAFSDPLPQALALKHRHLQFGNVEAGAVLRRGVDLQAVGDLLGLSVGVVGVDEAVDPVRPVEAGPALDRRDVPLAAQRLCH